MGKREKKYGLKETQGDEESMAGERVAGWSADPKKRYF